jgi:hypothetical protein
LRFISMMAVLQDRVLHGPRTHAGCLEKVAQDRLVSRLEPSDLVTSNRSRESEKLKINYYYYKNKNSNI